MAPQSWRRGRFHYVALWGLAISGSITAVLHALVILRLTPGAEDADFFNWLWVFNGVMFAVWGIGGLRSHHRAASRRESGGE